MEKWNEPLAPAPAWLDPASEVKGPTTHLSKAVFIATCIAALLRLGCSIAQALGVVANALNESAWGQSYRGDNLGGWKISKAGALNYLKLHGHPARWWRAPGNKSSGDPPWCFYWAFDSLEDFLGQWLTHFVPKPDAPDPFGIYRACGTAFWSGGDWFRAMVHAGYKGPVTRANPEPSCREHASLVHSAATWWAQGQLGLEVDGAWGPASAAACRAFQGAHGLPATGVLDDATLDALAAASVAPVRSVA